MEKQMIERAVSKTLYRENGKIFGSSGKSEEEVIRERNERVMEGVAAYASYYRSNPHRLAKEYLNIELKLFQKIVLYMMMLNNYFMFFGSRGLGKTFLSALYAVIRCILYPGTQVVVVSGTKGQARQVILKIKEDFCVKYGWGSTNLLREIKEIKDGVNDAKVEFHNGSWIKVVTASDNARGHRANVLIVDEFRMVSPKILDTVLKKFLQVSRQPPYLKKPEYAHMTERNMQMYLSSAWYQNHWSYTKAKDYVVKSLDDRVKYAICAFPYQLAVAEGLTDLNAISEEMQESDFDEIKWSMEMDTMFYGSGKDAFFKFDDIEGCRKLEKALYPDGMFSINKLNEVPPLIEGERRILSLDVALMGSDKKNDAAAIVVNRAIPDGNRYRANIVYIDALEGLRTEELAMITRRLYSWFKCTDLVIDAAGSGLGVYDALSTNITDDETGEIYEALSCINNEEMAARCTSPSAPKVIWSIKASAEFNTNIATRLREGFANRKITLLVSEDFIKGNSSSYKEISKLAGGKEYEFIKPFVQTSLLMTELINLKHEIRGNHIVLHKARDMRKDRYSSLAYNYWVQGQLELTELRRPTGLNQTLEEYAKQLKELSRRPTMY